jgi:3-isopropylmalate/(R)-2-methylmalate dehydratase small subunit
MLRFSTLSATAAPLPLSNIDTDKIIPARFLKTIRRDGLGKALFHTMRYADDGSEQAGFILNRPGWRHAQILVSRDNFGCGSSREHAPWALIDFGIRCIIAESFADIFYNNCFKNGILPIALDLATIDRLLGLAAEPATATFSVDLPGQTVTLSNGEVISFAISAERKRALLLGLDDISETLSQSDAIARFEATATTIAMPIPASPDALAIAL